MKENICKLIANRGCSFQNKKNLNRKKNVSMANKHLKNCSTAQMIGKGRTTMTNHLANSSCYGN